MLEAKRDRPAAALLLLADGRFPAGGYAHSGGLEPLVESGHVRDLDTLAPFLAGRAHTVGLMTATFAAASCRAVVSGDDGRLCELDLGLDARTPSPAQRVTSRQLGRQLLRTLRTVVGDARLDALDARPHHPVVFGAGGAVLGLDPHDAALGLLHESVAGPVAAAVRLLSLDPLASHAILARLGPLLDELAGEAERSSTGPVDELPAAAAPLLDIGAERHARRRTRLFAS